MTFLGALGALFAGMMLMGACADLKHAAPAEADGGALGNATSASDNASASPQNGPGPHGALPSGYCCSRDEECRHRTCGDVGDGQRMCLDTCRVDASCVRPGLPSFTCDSPDTFTDGHCKPPGGFRCFDPATFVRGARDAGACCSATGDGTAGLECAGGSCISIGPNPFVCTNRCTTPQDCASGLVCQRLADYSVCVPGNNPYTCN